MISPEDFAAESLSNYVASKKAYHDQLAKTRVGTELARPPTGGSRPPTGRSNTAGYAASPYAKEALSNYLSSKKAYNDQKEKTRRATQFAGEPVSAISTPRMSMEKYAEESKHNYLLSKAAYREMLERQ